MRNRGFVAVHRGGPLIINNHRKLIRWAINCVEHVLPFIEVTVDKPLTNALSIAKDWERGQATTGDAIKASLRAHAVAKASVDPVVSAIARAAGQAVATAHMADHSVGAALYALKALKLAGKSLLQERAWQTEQINQLPSEIADLVLNTITQKEKGFKL